MRLSTAQLRDDFKTHLEQWEGFAVNQKIDESVLPEIQYWSVQIEKFIQEKVQLLEKDFEDFKLNDEYLRTVSESFDDLDRIMATQKTLIDRIEDKTLAVMIKNARLYYLNYFVPLFNILGKLENDYIAIAGKAIAENNKKVAALELKIKTLKTERRSIKNRLFSFMPFNKANEITKNIQELEIVRKLLRLTIQHDRLNLYYFNHERPPELKEIKAKADTLRAEVRQLIGANHVEYVE